MVDRISVQGVPSRGFTLGRRHGRRLGGQRVLVPGALFIGTLLLHVSQRVSVGKVGDRLSVSHVAVAALVGQNVEVASGRFSLTSQVLIVDTRSVLAGALVETW